ncbi:ATP synthase F0 subunit B [candidate division WOR-1 bacterium RIFCSPLOWO2_02_FULL_46_20]|uniref:ATP synthase subunit b n=1 Tax=candidate division WOR-1 bacterium RIFCSPLOWO2_02_FULL_46_20 TaxID=1802567 RepID=A0A1F4RCH5_UNCSA|nr:MAG: ATP synthase F0 subunit B [candidate division WOR-1 bacterium RIFCSPLOWO2_02_FULL_46_20]
MFEFETGIIIWTSISFAVLVFLMYRYALPPLITVLKEREQLIAGSLTDAETRQKESQAVLASARERLTETDRIAQKIITDAKRETEAIKKEARLNSEKEAATFLAAAKEELVQEQKQIVSQLKEQTADLVILAAQKILNQKIDQDANRRLIDEAIKECRN